MTRDRALRYLHDISSHFRAYYRPEDIEPVWPELLAEPEESMAVVVSRIRQGPRYGLPSPGSVLMMVRNEAKTRPAMREEVQQSSEEYGRECLQLVKKLVCGQMSQGEYLEKLEHVTRGS